METLLIRVDNIVVIVRDIVSFINIITGFTVTYICLFIPNLIWNLIIRVENILVIERDIVSFINVVTGIYRNIRMSIYTKSNLESDPPSYP